MNPVTTTIPAGRPWHNALRRLLAVSATVMLALACATVAHAATTTTTTTTAPDMTAGAPAGALTAAGPISDGDLTVKATITPGPGACHGGVWAGWLCEWQAQVTVGPAANATAGTCVVNDPEAAALPVLYTVGGTVSQTIDATAFSGDCVIELQYSDADGQVVIASLPYTFPGPSATFTQITAGGQQSLRAVISLPDCHFENGGCAWIGATQSLTGPGVQSCAPQVTPAAPNLATGGLLDGPSSLTVVVNFPATPGANAKTVTLCAYIQGGGLDRSVAGGQAGNFILVGADTVTLPAGPPLPAVPSTAPVTPTVAPTSTTPVSRGAVKGAHTKVAARCRTPHLGRVIRRHGHRQVRVSAIQRGCRAEIVLRIRHGHHRVVVRLWRSRDGLVSLPGTGGQVTVSVRAVGHDRRSSAWQTRRVRPR